MVLPPEPASSAGFSLLYADAEILVLDKPSGLLAVPGRGPDKQDCLSARVQATYQDALVVHRLDMATSGLLVMARGAEAQRTLHAAFASRQVYKRYEAVVSGDPRQRARPNLDAWNTIDLAIRVDWERRPLRIIDPATGQHSTTRWRVLSHDSANNTTRLALEPVTGRSHQLRVHLQALGHPILGDALYAPGSITGAAPRLLLHAAAVAFKHPVSGQAMAFESPPDF